MLQTYLKEPTWNKALQSEFEKPYLVSLMAFLQRKYKSKTAVYPPKEKIFEALNLTPLKKIKAVILGQDPYHQAGQAHGLSFSVQEGTRFPPSLQNILKEFSDCFETSPPRKGDLSPWAKQGVLLLNAVLTVEEGKPNSHEQKGWEIFTDKIIQIVNEEQSGVVFVLWGNYAQKKAGLIDEKKHFVIKAPHPSPLSSYRGFFGSKPFLKINKYLESRGEKPIDWNL